MKLRVAIEALLKAAREHVEALERCGTPQRLPSPMLIELAAVEFVHAERAAGAAALERADHARRLSDFVTMRVSLSAPGMDEIHLAVGGEILCGEPLALSWVSSGMPGLSYTCPRCRLAELLLLQREGLNAVAELLQREAPDTWRRMRTALVPPAGVEEGPSAEPPGAPEGSAGSASHPAERRRQ